MRRRYLRKTLSDILSALSRYWRKPISSPDNAAMHGWLWADCMLQLIFRVAMTMKTSQQEHGAPTSCICQKEDCRASFSVPDDTVGAALWLHEFLPRRAGSPLGKTAVVACVELSTVHVAKVDSGVVSSRGIDSVSHWTEEFPSGSDQSTPLCCR